MNGFLEHLLHEFQLPLSNPVLIFSLILFIILLSPILLRKINIPGIIGLILSGVIIGPNGLNVLEKSSAVELFSTIGLLYIMFIAGLELDMNEFKANRNKSLLFGFFTFILPMSVGFPACYYLLGYDFNASFLTASMFATHTLVAYPIVSKLGVSKNQAVAVTVGGTILTDTAVLIILAVIIGKSKGSLNQEFWIRLIVSLAIFSAILFLVIPRVAKWFFQKLESENHAHYIFVLSVVFFAAFLAEVAGVEPIIGAFMAGLALNRLIPHSSALMNRIDFIGNALFIPFFLISVGMVVDVAVILSGPTALLVAGVLTLVALFGKWLAAFFTQLAFQYSKPQRQLIFGLSSAHAAATLAIILIGYRANIIDENILNGTIILILITCIVASFATEKAARKILLSDENGDGLATGSSQLLEEHILVPVANYANIEKLLEFGFFIKDKKSVNPVTMLSVVPNNEEAELNIIKARNKLDSFVRQGAAIQLRVNPVTTIDHNPANGIARISREIMANIIVIGWPSKAGFFDKMFGEKVDSIISLVDKNLMVCQFEKPFVAQKRIVLLSPALAEKENGFPIWLQKVVKMAQELGLSIVHFGDERTYRAIQSELALRKLSVPIQQRPFSDWDDFLVLARDIRFDDLIIHIAARKGSISHHPKLEGIPAKLEKHFEKNNKIVVYPQEHGPGYLADPYEHFSTSPLSKGMETIEQIGKGIGSIFKKD